MGTLCYGNNLDILTRSKMRRSRKKAWPADGTGDGADRKIVLTIPAKPDVVSPA
jgi:hypothetical protein